MIRKRTAWLPIVIALLATMAILVAACSDGGAGAGAPPAGGLAESEQQTAPEQQPTPPEQQAPPAQQQALPEREDFVFTRGNFPRMDGSTATVPLAQAVACVLLGEPREAVAGLAEFNRTTQSFRNLAAGLCDILIVSEPAPEVFNELSEQGFEIEMAPIATDALVFVVNASNPVDGLTTEQIQEIYMGKIANWSQVGGNDTKIEAFQRYAEAGSQVLMDKLVMDGLDMSDAPMTQFPIALGMGELIEAIKGFDGSASALGYTLYYYAEDMRMAEGLKIISVDGVNPGPGTIRSGEYPFLNPYFVVIGAGEPEDSPARIMYEWLQSGAGQALVGHEGYVSVR